MQTLESVQQAIGDQGLHWNAGQTPVGQVLAAGRYRGFGLSSRVGGPSGSHGPLTSRAAFASSGVRSAPVRVDWRDFKSQDWTTPVRDQGECGACVAFAVCAMMESRYKILKADPGMSIDLSEAQLFFCGGPADGCEFGWEPGRALVYARKRGVCAESLFPYIGGPLVCRSEERDHPPLVKVKKWTRIRTHGSSDKDRKFAIFDRGPLVGCMNVYSDFGWYTGGVYRPTTADVVAQHAVLVVGYDDTEGCWIIKNSWGTDWGAQGWAKIGYGSCGLDAQFDFFEAEVI